MDLREFKRNHGIACAFVQRRELTWGIRAGSRLADARLNLSPIAHWTILYQPHARGASSTRGKSEEWTLRAYHATEMQVRKSHGR